MPVTGLSFVARRLPVGTAMDIHEIRKRLEEEVRSTGSRLRERGGAVDPKQLDEATPTEGPAGDAFDRIKATQDREGDLLSRERLADRLDRLVEALGRIDDGSYGTCAGCGNPIGWRRLAAIPEAARCITCQERAEPLHAGRAPARSAFAGTPRSATREDDD